MPADKQLAALLAELIAVLCRYRELVTGDETADHIVTYDQPEESSDRAREYLAEGALGVRSPPTPRFAVNWWPKSSA